MKVDWNSCDIPPNQEGWYLIKTTTDYNKAYWFAPPKNPQFSLCGEYARCVVKNVIGWVEIEN